MCVVVLDIMKYRHWNIVKQTLVISDRRELGRNTLTSDQQLRLRERHKLSSELDIVLSGNSCDILNIQ